jgi:hypothetical protein
MDWQDERAFEIRGEMGCVLRFDSFGKRYNEEGWITARASLKNPYLAYRFSLYFRSGELETFATELQQLLQQSRADASLTTLEEQAACTVTLGSCRGTLQHYPPTPTVVTFEFETERASLGLALSELRKVCASLADGD